MESIPHASPNLSLKDKITLLLIGLFLGGVLALIPMDSAGWVFDYEDHFIEVIEGAPTPKLDFAMVQTGPDAVRVTLDLENISLVELCSGEDQGRAKGHAHIFLNGKKQGSFYILDHTLENLPAGVHTVTVSINQPPSHKVLSWKGKPLSVSKTIKIE